MQTSQEELARLEEALYWTEVQNYHLELFCYSEVLKQLRLSISTKETQHALQTQGLNRHIEGRREMAWLDRPEIESQITEAAWSLFHLTTKKSHLSYGDHPNYIVIVGGSGIGKTRTGNEIRKFLIRSLLIQQHQEQCLEEKDILDTTVIYNISYDPGLWHFHRPEWRGPPKPDFEHQSFAFHKFGVCLLSSLLGIDYFSIPSHSYLLQDLAACFSLFRDLLGIQKDNWLFLIIHFHHFEQYATDLVYLLQIWPSIQQKAEKSFIVLLPVLTGNMTFAPPVPSGKVIDLPPFSPKQSRQLVISSISKWLFESGHFNEDSKRLLKSVGKSFPFRHLTQLCGGLGALLYHFSSSLYRQITSSRTNIDWNGIIRNTVDRLLQRSFGRQLTRPGSPYAPFKNAIIKLALFGDVVQENSVIRGKDDSTTTLGDLRCCGLVYLKQLPGIAPSYNAFQLWMPALLLCHLKPKWFNERMLEMGIDPYSRTFEALVLCMHRARLLAKASMNEMTTLEELYGPHSESNPRSLLETEVPRMYRRPLVWYEVHHDRSGQNTGNPNSIRSRDKPDIFNAASIRRKGSLLLRHHNTEAETCVLPWGCEQYNLEEALSQSIKHESYVGCPLNMETVRKAIGKLSRFGYGSSPEPTIRRPYIFITPNQLQFYKDEAIPTNMIWVSGIDALQWLTGGFLDYRAFCSRNFNPNTSKAPTSSSS